VRRAVFWGPRKRGRVVQAGPLSRLQKNMVQRTNRKITKKGGGNRYICGQAHLQNGGVGSGLLCPARTGLEWGKDSGERKSSNQLTEERGGGKEAGRAGEKKKRKGGT